MDQNTSNDTSQDQSQTDAPYAFFALVFLLSIPFWILGTVVDQDLMPGLPLSSLMVVCPGLAALTLRWRASGRRGAFVLLARVLDARRLRTPWLVALLVLINPGLYAASYGIQRAIGVDLPTPDIQIGPTLFLLALFLIAAMAEEVGWTGYALEPLQHRWGVVGAGLMIGVVAVAWHLPALVQAERAIDWVIWWAFGTVASRVLLVWLYDNTGRSVFGISLCHALSNVSWQTYPVQGSYFDPSIMALLTLAVVILAWLGSWR